MINRGTLLMKSIIIYFKETQFKLYGIYAAITLFIYFPLISQHFAMTDDYAMLDIALGHSGNLLEWDIANGRSIYGIFQYLVQYHMVNISRLSWLRYCSILSTIITCCFIHKFISVKVKLSSQSFIFYLPIFLMFIPSIVVYNAWATCFVFILSILLSGVAYYCIFDENRETTIIKFCGGLVVLICSFFIYQATAMMFLYFVFFNNCIDSRKIKLSNLIVSAVALVIAMIMALLSVKLLPKLLYGYVIERSNLNTDFISKFNWLLKGPLRIAINNYNINPSIIYVVVSVLILFLGCFYLFRSQQGVLKILLAVLLMVGIMAPALLAKESWTATRSSVGLYFIITTIMLYGLVKLCEQYLLKYNVRIIIGCVLFVVCIYTQHYIYSSIIRQQQAEYQALTQEMVSIVPRDYTGLIRFDLSNQLDGAFTRIHLSDEIGHTSIQIPWALRGIARSIKQLKGFHYQIDNSNLVLNNKEECKNNCIIIHPGDILRKAENYK